VWRGGLELRHDKQARHKGQQPEQRVTTDFFEDNLMAWMISGPQS
jgi:hypothetical protein